MMEIEYPKLKKDQKFKLLRKTDELMTQLKSDLEDIMFIEHQEKANTNIFYGQLETKDNKQVNRLLDRYFEVIK